MGPEAVDVDSGRRRSVRPGSRDRESTFEVPGDYLEGDIQEALGKMSHRLRRKVWGDMTESELSVWWQRPQGRLGSSGNIHRGDSGGPSAGLRAMAPGDSKNREGAGRWAGRRRKEEVGVRAGRQQGRRLRQSHWDGSGS